MGRIKLLLTSGFISLIVLSIGEQAFAAGAGCGDVEITMGTCADVRSNVAEDELMLHASERVHDSSEAHSDEAGLFPSRRGSRPDPIQDGAYLPGCPDIQFDASNCVYNAPDAPPPQDTPGPAPTVTLEDLASFSPRADRLSAEPGDWAIAGLAVNPVADDAPASASGELLGLPAEVRFTPVEFLWDHGDGSTLSTSDGGATWAELGQTEFSGTATSHVYGEPGVYTLALSVRFAAEYAVGGGPWTPVAGTLLAESGSFEIIVGSAGTVLVDRDCRTGARGPGC